MGRPPSVYGIDRQQRRRQRVTIIVCSLLAFYAIISVYFDSGFNINGVALPPDVVDRRNALLARCDYIRRPAGPPPNFASRRQSDRYDPSLPGNAPMLIRNARIWTGAQDGVEVVHGDLLLDKGLIKSVGSIPPAVLSPMDDVQVKDVEGAWITPGLVDLHSHIGVGSAPHLSGAADSNSRKAPILPWLRSIDGLNTHDDSYALAIAGGVTTAQVLPGSANNIGGQSFLIKLRPTSERSPTSKVLEPPWSLNGSHNPTFDYTQFPRWRHMKHACGENPSRVYSQTRMDSGWQFRHAYDEARKVRDAQDKFCDLARAGRWREIENEEKFPDSFEWEALVDVLRSKVKVSTHCYEAVDLDGIVRLTNEFKFPVASFHHAGETYLVPDLLKKAWGGAPTIALFASNFRKKREAYRGSEFAPAILAEHGIPVVMKSDHPVINSRYLMHEAAQAHYHGLPAHLALASVTTTPAAAAGMSHRVGKVVAGFDADLVIWDSHPLSLSATPVQVYIDGVPQLSGNFTSKKPSSFQEAPRTPDFKKEREQTVEWEGLPPLSPHVRAKSGEVWFTNVKEVYQKVWDAGESVVKRFGEGFIAVDNETGSLGALYSVLVRDGRIECIGMVASECSPSSDAMEKGEVMDLEGGELVPGLTSFGSPLGLVEIRLEPSTNDGTVIDVLAGGVPKILEETVVRAVDGLQIGGRNALLAYRSGVTSAVSAPVGPGPLLGLSTTLSTSALSAFEDGGAVLRDVGALHIRIAKGMRESVSTQIGWLRRMLSRKDAAGGAVWDDVRQGVLALVIHVESADIMASLLHLKSEVDEDAREQGLSSSLRITFAGAAEAHLLASEIAQQNVSVILAPSRPFPGSWDQRRILPGPPLSNDSAIVTLREHGVNVAIGVVDEYAARNTRWDIAWAALESHGRINKTEALSFATTSLEKALGLGADFGSLPYGGTPGITDDDLVAYHGGSIFDFESKVAGVISPRRGHVDLF